MAVSSPQADYKQEVRFAVVMYGGVSLAIYINGVCQELYRIVRSTAEVESDSNGNRSPAPANEVDGTERVYRKLAYLLSDARLLAQYRNYVKRIDSHRVQLEKEALDGATRKKRLEELVAAERPDPLEDAVIAGKEIETRFVVDILSGTSAGGINAIYLAKAFANDQEISQLKDLWVNEGDIALLLNDKRSVRGLHLRNQSPPQSLLNSRRLYFKLLKSLNDMEKQQPSHENFKSPYVDELDLFVTATDIEGVPVPLRLSDSIVFERRHRKVFHFKYAKAEVVGDDINDFRGVLDPFLAFAARCTSSFPFAFEPMRLTDIDEVLKLFGGRQNLSRSDSQMWQRFFREELDPRTGSPVQPPRFALRSFGDGGYLDNKPFSYATEMLMQRQSDVPVDRKLIYIEPSPAHPEDRPAGLEKPNALQNVKAAVLDLPTYETIREDLQRVLERNQLIMRVNKIITGIEKDVANYIPHAVRAYLSDPTARRRKPAVGIGSGLLDDKWTDGEKKARPAGTPPEWADSDLADMVMDFSRYFLPYRRLRVTSVTDDIAKLVSRLAGFDENSDQFLAIRHLVRAWREERYADYKEEGKYTVNRFLWEFDLPYRLRRLSTTRNRVDQITRFDDALIEELRGYEKSLIEIRKLVDQESEDWERLEDENPQIRLHIYGERLLPYVREQPPRLSRVLRFVKSELNEIYKNLRTTGRRLRSRRALAIPEAGRVSIAQNPLLKHLPELGITPKDLNEILGTTTEATRAMASALSLEDDHNEEDCFKRAVEIMARDGAKVGRGIREMGNELRNQLSVAFQVTRDQTAPLFSPDKEYTPISQRGKELMKEDPGLISSDMGKAVRGFISYYYNNFDDYDQIRFPILYETGGGESDVIEIIRISPEDATSLISERRELIDSASPGKARQKLAGVSLHHFGAFLDRTWRLNDIMWGRLDGSERLLAAMLPGSQNELVRKTLIGEAHLAIIKEDLKPQSQVGLEKAMTEALLRASAGLPINDAINKTLEPLEGSPVKARLEEIMRLSLGDDELLKFMGLGYEVNRQLDPKPMLNSISRASQIIGSMFEQMANESGLEGKRLAWIARSGKLFWGLVEVAAPNSILNLLFNHWLKILYFFEALLVVGSILLGSKEVQTFGLKLLGLTLAVNVAVVLLRDYMRLRHRWQHVFLFVFVGAVLVLSLVGVGHLYGLGVGGVLSEIGRFVQGIWQRIAAT